ncbi:MULTISPECIES: hypothetical protein [unclassified Streptomyces]|uniref:hypothetical protein n=1 Tax=unclassified Streptomyces TaxID=2593676 RepID=UPI002E287BFC|nr:hypothetical protein [Streptomyces sp. NBC_00273]
MELCQSERLAAEVEEAGSPQSVARIRVTRPWVNLRTRRLERGAGREPLSRSDARTTLAERPLPTGAGSAPTVRQAVHLSEGRCREHS